MKKKYFIVILIILVIPFYFIKNKEEKYEDIYVEENSVVVEEVKKDTIKIHIIGEVSNPGIYEIEESSRIDDAIRIAGGATENADLNKTNLAYELSDGEKIYIPSIFDEDLEYNVNSGDTNSTQKININKASAEELQKINGVGESLANRIIEYRKENGKFANIEDLKNVSGIGDKKFESIKNQIVVK